MESTSTHPSSRANTPRGLVLAALVTLFAFATDQLTKLWAVSALADGRPVGLLGDYLSVTLTRNSGAAFSLGASSTWIFTLLSIIIIAALLYMLFRASSLRVSAAIGVLLGGALGNLMDRLVQPPSFGAGHVIDFIDYGGFFVGNVADIWIVLGAAWLACELILHEKATHE